MEDEDLLVAKWQPLIDSIDKIRVPSDLLGRLIIKMDTEEGPKQKNCQHQKLEKERLFSSSN